MWELKAIIVVQYLIFNFKYFLIFIYFKDLLLNLYKFKLILIYILLYSFMMINFYYFSLNFSIILLFLYLMVGLLLIFYFNFVLSILFIIFIIFNFYLYFSYYYLLETVAKDLLKVTQNIYFILIFANFYVIFHQF
mgnify:CR=1 FL=1|jgi:hypothetical protein